MLRLIGEPLVKIEKGHKRMGSDGESASCTLEHTCEKNGTWRGWCVWACGVLAAMLVFGGPSEVSSMPSAESPVVSAEAQAKVSAGLASPTKSWKRELPKTLSREHLSEGFRNIRRSVDQCITRHVKGGSDFPMSKVRVEVTVQGSGRVSRLKMHWKINQTVFGRCMRAHLSRWRFAAFQGQPIRVAQNLKVVLENPSESAKLVRERSRQR